MSAPVAPYAERPPYRAAVAVTLLVLLGYAASLAPTVTFWDAGELVAASRILGIPHPPGTPLFVLIAHVWGMLVPVGEYAARTNLLSALMSATGAGCFFLVLHQSLAGVVAGLEPGTARTLRLVGAAAAAVLGAFTFTNWQNSNETEVYAAATCTIGLVSWLVHVWRRARGTERAPRILLLVIFLAGVSIGNHLLALLAGPGVVGFVVATLAREPARDERQRRAEWGEAAVLAGIWTLLIGTGLGSATIGALGAVAFVAGAVVAARGGQARFAIAALAIAAIGVTPYLYLYLRAAQSPILNEADPSTWRSLLAVIRREQYPVRTPLDDPTIFHSAENPGRSLTIIWLQIQNYLLYFIWQWGRSIRAAWLQIVLAGVYFALGARGFMAQRRSDRAGWWLLFLIWLVTGPGLLVYMNFKPGFSQGFREYPNFSDHEVRERDYFFVVSFVVWGLWAGIGLVREARRLVESGRPALRRLAWAPLALAVLPVATNWMAADRRHGPDARLAADFAYDLLNTAPPYGILFTYGDNDTFPLWWAQEVEGIRQDVTVVCLALAQTDWYVRQLRDQPARPFDPARAPDVWRNAPAVRPTSRVHTMTDAEIASAMNGVMISEPREVRIGPMTRRLEPGTPLYPNDIASLRIVQENFGRRPILWAITTGHDFAGLRPYVVQQGLGFRLDPVTAQAPGSAESALGAEPIDVPLTEQLVWRTYRYAGLFGADVESLEPTARSIAATLGQPFSRLALAYEARGDSAAMIRNLERAAALSPSPQLRAAVQALRARPFGAPRPEPAQRP